MNGHQFNLLLINLIIHRFCDYYNNIKKAREGCGLCHGNDKLYLFGGTNGKTRLNDLWTFDLSNSKWKSVYIKQEICPNV